MLLMLEYYTVIRPFLVNRMRCGFATVTSMYRRSINVSRKKFSCSLRRTAPQKCSEMW